MTAASDGAWREHLVERHDYAWARLPFVVPMALAVKRRRGDRRGHAIARDVVALSSIVLDHMAREERALARHEARAIRERLHDDHVAVAGLLASLREEATDTSTEDATERALFAELARLDAELAAQIAAEERLLAAQS
jgi:hypothetical protein